MNNKFALGALHFGSLLTEKESEAIILCALSKGISFIDTAPLYGNGLSEQIIGHTLTKHHLNAFIATKVGLKINKRADGIFGVTTHPLTYQNIKTSVELSLKNLQRDVIDLLMLHAFDKVTPLQETIEALNRLYQEGLIKNFGCSNYNPEQLKKMIRAAKKYSLVPFTAAQCHYNLIERRAERIFTGLCDAEGLQIVINRALARGALSGKYKSLSSLPENSRAAGSPRIRKWLTAERMVLLERLSALADDYQIPLTSISLQWMLKKHPRALLLLGVRSISQLDECLQSQIIDWNNEIFEKIEMLIGKEKHVLCSPPCYFEK